MRVEKVYNSAKFIQFIKYCLTFRKKGYEY